MQARMSGKYLASDNGSGAENLHKHVEVDTKVDRKQAGGIPSALHASMAHGYWLVSLLWCNGSYSGYVTIR